ncbi:unnamed protein product [Moneuplotes crassus]|uniref:Uncharacterized protein n=1 Tax=Euplotes crassus TaxID=5936 RepID=A0AAD1Y4G9_EUPCR|nr:unnamed protein product [Moneuplotes crassus]
MFPRTDQNGSIDFEDETNDSSIQTNRAPIRRRRVKRYNKEEQELRDELKGLIHKAFDLNLILLSYVGSTFATKLCTAVYFHCIGV